MNNNYYLLPALLFLLLLCGCSTKMVYLNTQKPPEVIQKDKDECQKAVDASDFKDQGLKRKKFNQCMKDKGYNVVSEEKAQKLQGFIEVWIKPGADLKAYEAVFVDKVDLSQMKIDMNVPKVEAGEKEKINLGEEMLKRFSAALGFVAPVILDKDKVRKKKALYVSLRLDKAAQTNLGLNAGLQVVGQFTPPYVPLPDAPIGTFSFQAVVADYTTREKLMIVSDECDEDKNASLAGIENFERWKHAYNIMDYWADHLAALIAKERGQKYKSRLGWKLVDF